MRTDEQYDTKIQTKTIIKRLDDEAFLNCRQKYFFWNWQRIDPHM